MIQRLIARLIGKPTSEAAVARTDGGEALEHPSTGEGSDSESRRERDETERVLDAFPKHLHDILHRTKAPLFVVDDEGSVIVWNEGMTELTGNTEAEARAEDQLSDAWYHEGRRNMTLADKIIDTPRDTHREYDVEKVDWVPYDLYQDQSTYTDAEGATRHIQFSAAPLFEAGEFVGVVEYVEERTKDVRRQQELEGLVTDLTEGMHALEEGNLGVQVEVAEPEYISDDLCDIVDAFNEMSERLERTVESVGDETVELRDSAQEIADKTDDVTDLAHEQRDALEEVSGEVADMSATVEEIASTTDQVSATAEEAVELAESGNEAAMDAQDSMAEVSTASESVMDEIESLQQRVSEIDDVVEVIDDIAEQTNMLALNANIEAARAETGGGGFAVVADEVKQLAEESQRNADEIESMVAEIQTDTAETVQSLETMNERIDDGTDQVQAAMDDLSTITDRINETARGIQEVAEATDDQAASSEEIASMVDEVVETAARISDEVDEIAAINKDHATRADSIEADIERLSRR